MRKQSNKAKLRDILKTTGLDFSILPTSWGQRLRICSRDEEAKEIRQLNAVCDPELGPGANKQGSVYKGHYRDNQENWNIDCILLDNSIVPMLYFLIAIITLWLCRQAPWSWERYTKFLEIKGHMSVTISQMGLSFF